MKHKGKFAKIKKTKKRMYGPRVLMVCGYPEEERSIFLRFIDKIGINGVRVIFATSNYLKIAVGEILASEDLKQSSAISKMPRAVIMSGLTQKELHSLMGSYRKEGFKSQIWAALTPVSEKWPLETLLRHLEDEKKASEQKPSPS